MPQALVQIKQGVSKKLLFYGECLLLFQSSLEWYVCVFLKTQTSFSSVQLEHLATLFKVLRMMPRAFSFMWRRYLRLLFLQHKKWGV